MSKQILIELVGENETGYCYADLYLPASAEEIAEAKERANWNSDSNGIRDISIEHCSTLPKLASFRLDSPTLDELNFLAQRLDAMDGGERTIMNGVLQYLCSEKGFADELVSMTDLINMTYGLDGVMIASNVGTDRQLGQFVIDNELNEDVNAIPETSLYLLDLERIGRLQRDVDGGVFVGNCYVVAGAFEMPHVYDGIHLPGAEPPACEQQGIRHISEQELRAMAGQEGLVLQGCGGDLKEWVDGINGLLTESGILRNGTVFTEAYAFSHDGLTKLAKKKKSEWNMVEIFADEGISGMKAKNRPEFQRMIRMCELHQIDLIVTKSVSRFARNVKEALEYVRNLKLLGVGVIFEKEGINTMSLGDEMLLNTFTAIAQEESKAISQNQRLSIVKRMELGVYVDSNAPYGFHLENKQLVEYPPEADIVRWIFQAYLRGMSTAEIAKDLSDRGVPTKNGKEKWKSSKISYMLSNERYIGDCCYQKTYRGTTVPFKQSKNRGEEDMYYATGTHAPIVEKDLFEKVQVLLKKRKEQFTKATTQNIYPLSSRIRCSECGSFYRRKVRSGGVKWVCARHEEDFKACNSNYYSEERRRGTHVACGEQPSGHRYS